MKISDVKARQILDSRGNPTVEVDIILENGIIGRASVPSGASVGSNEALELRDNEKDFDGKGVLKAVNNVNTELRKLLVGTDAYEQKKIDREMIKLDNTKNKSRLGANAILGCSLAVLKAASLSSGKELYQYIGNNKELPVPMINILNGGRHADNKLDIQEFMIVPNKDSLKENLKVSAEVFYSLKKELKRQNLSTNVGDEGGFAPLLNTTNEALDLIVNSIKKAGYIPGKDIFLALDVAASEFYKNGIYYYEGRTLNNLELLWEYKKLIEKYPIISLEDPYSESDYEGFSLITNELGNKIMVVGDDLFVTNKEILSKGIENNLANSILLKMNQVGTITEMLETIELARKNNYNLIISHRSGETEDTSIADLAVGLGIGKIKTGSLSRGERICKYNRLIRIEEMLDI